MGYLRHFFKRKTGLQDFKPVILVTGCNSGLGRATARLLYRQLAYRVVVTARAHSVDELKKEFLESDRVWVRALDVTSNAQRKSLIDEITDKWGGVDILVNNAGISYRSVVEHMDDASEINQLNVNYLGPMALIRKCLPAMRKKGRGKIINISSVSGMLAMPTMSSYSASKHALEGASEALWYEMRPLGINVTLVQPGFIHSNSFKHVYYSPLADTALKSGAAYTDYYANMAPFVGRMMHYSLTTPEHVARTVLRTIKTQNPPLWVPATLDATLFYYLRRFVPRRFFHPLLFALLPGASKWGKSYSKSRDL